MGVTRGAHASPAVVPAAAAVYKRGSVLHLHQPPSLQGVVQHFCNFVSGMLVTISFTALLDSVVKGSTFSLFTLRYVYVMPAQHWTHDLVRWQVRVCSEFCPLTFLAAMAMLSICLLSFLGLWFHCRSQQLNQFASYSRVFTLLCGGLGSRASPSLSEGKYGVKLQGSRCRSLSVTAAKTSM